MDITGCDPDEAARKVKDRLTLVPPKERSQASEQPLGRMHRLEGRTMACAKDDTREQRIAMEAVVDAHDFGERAMGWYYYLDDKMKFPFKARCRFARPISVLED